MVHALRGIQDQVIHDFVIREPSGLSLRRQVDSLTALSVSRRIVDKALNAVENWRFRRKTLPTLVGGPLRVWEGDTLRSESLQELEMQRREAAGVVSQVHLKWTQRHFLRNAKINFMPGGHGVGTEDVFVEHG